MSAEPERKRARLSPPIVEGDEGDTVMSQPYVGGSAAIAAASEAAACIGGAGDAPVRDLDFLLRRATPFGNETGELPSGIFAPGPQVRIVDERICSVCYGASNGRWIQHRRVALCDKFLLVFRHA